MATNGGFEATNDLEASKSPNENDQPTDNTANQTRRFLEVDYRNTKHSAICSIIVFLALILILGAVMFVLIFLLDGQEAGPDRELQTELKGTFILSVTITIVNLDYQSSLSDPTSKDYIDLENRFSKKIASVLSQTDLMDKYRGVEITNVRSGSVILDFLLLFCEPLMTQDDVIQTVQEALTSSGSPNTVVGDELIISQNNLVIEAAPQQTSLQNISCSDPRPTSTPVMTSSPSTVMSSSTSQPLSPTPTSSPTSTPAVSSSISTLTPASSSVTSSQTTSMTPSVEMTMMTSSIITSQAAVPTTTSTAPSLSSTMAAKTTTMTSTSMSSSAQPTTTQMQTAPPTRSTTAALQPSTTISSKRTVLMSSTVTPEQTTQMMTTSIGVLETSPSVTQPTVIATTESLPNCDISQGQILSAGDVKVISSPGYPRGYLNNLNCQWSVTGIASENMVILLEFVFFDVGDDYLEVNIPTEGQINQRFSGSSTPPSIRSQDRNIQLRFVSDGAVTSIGFEVRLRLVSVLETTPPAITTEALGGMDTSPSVTKPTVIATTGSLPGCDISQGQILSAGDVKIISSPGYPRGYLNNLNCEWSVTGIASENMVILLEFVFFDVGDDYLEVNIPTEGQINQRFSGSSTPPSIRSQDQNIQLRFVSDGAITSIGFQVTVRLVSVLETTPPTLTTEAMACSDDLSFVTQEQNQTLTSPGYPNAYSSNMNCQWMLQSTIPNSQIILTFLTFDIGDDLLRIEHNGRTVELTGADLPMPIITDSANVNLVFTSNNVNNQNPGFEILAHIYIPPVSTQAQLTEITTTAPPQIPIAPPDNSCIPGSILISVESGPKTFSSPGYPDYNYASNTECSWNFILIGSSIENKALQLRFVNFDVGDDSVVVEGSSPAIRRFQGSALPPLIISSGNKFVIKLTTDSQDNHPGFNATVSVVDK
ncbi:tolloid-like protein 2 isoform X6 [Apostichopus japonicus]|uniref:tolloid-like protein 2 isoform X6 n=1 Tax=Stichopus japonicus TaxID=307972 RepID=UPI003AB273EE